MEQQLPEFVIAEELARVTRSVPGVADLYGGTFGTIATYGRGGRVLGIRVQQQEGRLAVEVHVIATYTPDLKVPAFADTVREHIRQHLRTMKVGPLGDIDVVVADIEVPQASPRMRTP
jgi:uncharacterized alkaline shock family protein YloU